jgi:hypothetical protein
MTQLLEKDFSVACTLPDSKQDLIASMILDEFSFKQKWEGGFSKSPKELSILADESLAEFISGKTKPLIF